jgi:hypothetical protein
MKRLAKFLCATAVIFSMILASFSIVNAITNGQPDENRHPYVGLTVFDDAPGHPVWSCSASLIAPDVVLTAGHCTAGAVAARVWFAEVVQDNPEYPYSGTTSYDGIPYTNPNYCLNCGSGNGIPTFMYRDLGVIVLTEPVPAEVVNEYAQLPIAGLVDTLKNKTPIELVGYGDQVQIPGGGVPPAYRWVGVNARLYALSELISGHFAYSAEFMRFTRNPGGGKGGTCYGDSGGPALLDTTDTILAVDSFGTNANCSGVGNAARVDVPEVLAWIASFLE